MLVIDRGFIERYCSEYDLRNRGTKDQIQEIAILNWVSAQSPPRFLNKEYFIRLGRWKTPRYQKTRESNDEENIIEITRSSYSAQGELKKLNILKRLKGVGVAVASTILYFLEPDRFAIFDYHVRNTLVKAGKLSKADEDSSKRVWLKYVQVIRELSSLYNKTLREVEKALFAYDKWGCGGSSAESNEGEDKRMGEDEALEVALSPEKMKLLKRVAEDEFGVNASALARFWIIERLLRFEVRRLPEQMPNECIGSQSAPETVYAKVSLPQNGQSWEISRMGKNKTKRVLEKGGPLDLSTAVSQFRATWHERKEGSRILWIPIKLSIGSNVYDAYWHYREKTGGSWIGSELNAGEIKLTDPLRNIGLNPGDEVKLMVQGNVIQVAK